MKVECRVPDELGAATQVNERFTPACRVACSTDLSFLKTANGTEQQLQAIDEQIRISWLHITSASSYKMVLQGFATLYMRLDVSHFPLVPSHI